LSEAIGVFVLAGVRLYREGLVEALDRSGTIDVVGVAANPEIALREVDRLRPAVAVLDVAGPAGLELVRELRSAMPATRIVVLAIAGAADDVLPWAEAGISGYVTCDDTLADLVDAVRAAVRGESRCSPEVSGALLERVHVLASERPVLSGVALLTDREREIAELLEERLTNKEIANRLQIELPTVKNHVHNILAKLEVSRRGDAAAEFRRARLGIH
jgi:DNA-binding NarL/FixJ family response regulator